MPTSRELLDWLSNFGRGKQPGDAGYPRRIFLVHGDPEAQIAIEPKVKALGFETHDPALARAGHPRLIDAGLRPWRCPPCVAVSRWHGTVGHHQAERRGALESGRHTIGRMVELAQRPVRRRVR